MNTYIICPCRYTSEIDIERPVVLVHVTEELILTVKDRQAMFSLLEEELGCPEINMPAFVEWWDYPIYVSTDRLWAWADKHSVTSADARVQIGQEGMAELGSCSEVLEEALESWENAWVTLDPTAADAGEMEEMRTDCGRMVMVKELEFYWSFHLKHTAVRGETAILTLAHLEAAAGRTERKVE